MWKRLWHGGESRLQTGVSFARKLQREDRLQQIVKLVGPDVLPETQRWILFVAQILKDGFLTQSAYDEKDMYCTPERQIALLRIMLTLYRKGREMIEAGVPLASVEGLSCVSQVLRAKSAYGNTELDRMIELERRVLEELETLAKESTRQSG